MSDWKWLEEIEKRLKNITAGPWRNGYWSGRCHENHDHSRDVCAYQYTLKDDDERSCCYVAGPEPIEIIGADDYGPILSKENAAFIANAPANLAMALQCIKEMREALEGYRGVSCQKHWEIKEGSVYSLADETLTRCAEGKVTDKRN